jgi:hypothetical protein
VENGKAVGVKLRNGGTLRARKAVVSNASSWDTLKLLPEGSVPAEWRKERAGTPECGSFMHLHLGIDKKVSGETKKFDYFSESAFIEGSAVGCAPVAAEKGQSANDCAFGVPELFAEKPTVKAHDLQVDKLRLLSDGRLK